LEFLCPNKFLPKDISLEKRMRFFSYRSFPQLWEKGEFYVFLSLGEKVIGMAHVGFFSMSARNENNWSISYVSVDKDYRSKGYSKMIVEEIFKEAKKRGLEISTSTYTIMGKAYLQKQFNEFADKYGVVFYDKSEEDSLMDNENMYVTIDGKMLHKSEV
jgi:GNAT superfamily N-acetyltransferase